MTAYVILVGEGYASALRLVGQSRTLRASAWGFAALIGLALVATLLIVRWLTGRLTVLARQMEAFREGGFTKPPDLPEPAGPHGDEIDVLGATFREMSGRIAEQIQGLRDMDRMRRDLVANVSHDLRTPMASVHGYLETLVLKAPTLTEGDKQRYLEVALKHSKGLSTMVAELFELAKLDAREVELHVEPFSLCELGQDVLQRFELLAASFHYLFATNAGSDTISVFDVRPDGTLELVDVEYSNGDHPISVTARRNLLYVMNGGASNCTGGTPSISGFRIGARGNLTPIPGSSRPISGGSNSGCAQVSFNPAGDVLVVTQRQADKIDTYLVDQGTGLTAGPIVNETTGLGPFGFTFTQRGFLLTTENFGAAPLQGGAASYDVPPDGVLIPLGPTTRNGRSDTCWIVNTDNGKYAYTTNFQTGDISSSSSTAMAPSCCSILSRRSSILARAIKL